MRKIYSTLKSVVAATLVAAMTFAASCSYDDTGVINQIEEIKVDLEALAQRVTALENKLQTEVENLQALIDGQVVIVDVETDAEGNQTIKLSDGSTITVLAPVECTCEPATPCQCDPLEYRVNADGVLEVSPDGINWVAITGVTPECVVANVVVEDGIATVTLADGTSFKTAVAELVEFEAAKSAIYVKAAETKSIAFAINDAVEDINVMNQPLGWKAAIEVPTRAVGGMDYVLNITAPAKDFLQYAEKGGKVSIHFNTAAGACKVMSVDVELAAIDLQVDKAGNITITTTVVDEYDYTDWYGETEHIVEFNNFYLAVFDLDTYYEINGDLESVYNSSWGEFNIPAAAGYINNIFANIGDNPYEGAQYIDGVNEKWTINATVESVLQNLDWYDQLPYEGNSFMVCVIPTDINANGAPVWAEAIAVPFKQLSISIVENVDARVYNNAYFDVTLRGAAAYYLYPVSKADIEEYLELGYADSTEGYFWSMLESYLQYPDWYSFGFKIESDVVEENIALADLLAYTRSYYYFETKPATEYVMCLFVEEDGRTDYTVEDLRFYEFATADLVEAETEFEVSYEMSDDWSLYTIGVDVTVPESTTTVYSRWYDESMPVEDLQADLIQNGYSRTEDDFAEGGYTFYLGTSVDAPATTKYLGLLVIDAAGNYTLKNYELASKDVVMKDAEFTIESVEFADDAVTVTLAGLEGLEVKAYKYYFIGVNGGSYYQKTEEECQDVAYSNSWLYKSTDTHPIVITSTADYKYSFAPGSYKLAVGVEFADGSFSKCVYGEYEYAVEGGETTVYNFVRGKQTGSLTDANIQLYTENDEYCLVLNLYYIITADRYIPEGEYVFGTTAGQVYCYNYTYLYDYSVNAKVLYFQPGYGKVKVSEVDGKYRIEVIDAKCLDANDNEVPFSTVYEGTIENLILPSEYVAPVQIEFTPVRAEYDLMFDLYEYNGGDAEYAFWLYDENNNYLEAICKFGPHTGWDYEYSAKYVGTDGEKVFSTIQTQAPSSYNCSSDAERYFSVKASMVDNSYIMFSDVLPAVAVNYLGEGSNYAPGSDNQGGTTEPVEPALVEFTSVAVAAVDSNLNYHNLTFTDGTYTAVIKLCTRGTTEYVAGLYDQNGSFGDASTLYIGGYANDNTWNGAECWPVTMEVVDNGDGTATFNLDYAEYPSAVEHHGTYTGVLEGLTLVEREEEPEQPGGVTTYEIIKATVGYDQPGEKEIQFWYSETNAHVIDFKGMDNCTPGQPIAAGYYSSLNGTIDEGYCIFDYGTTNGAVSFAECTVTDNGNGSLTYDAKFTSGGKDYAFVYTSPVQEGEEQDGPIVMTSMADSDQFNSSMYADFLFSDDSGNNQFVLIVDISNATLPSMTYSLKAYYDSIWIGGYFAFHEGTLKINGNVITNNAVITDGYMEITETAINIHATVDGVEYEFQYNK